jgi:tetratricopeptide (TPR) repeat protein
LFRGLVFYNIRNFNDAILCYEQAIKHNSSKKAVTKSIYEIAKIKIELRDFYGASYTLERAESLDVDKKVLEKIKLFTDGSTFLMKKKIKKGVDMLSQLIKKQNIN